MPPKGEAVENCGNAGQLTLRLPPSAPSHSILIPFHSVPFHSAPFPSIPLHSALCQRVERYLGQGGTVIARCPKYTTSATQKYVLLSILRSCISTRGYNRKEEWCFRTPHNTQRTSNAQNTTLGYYTKLDIDTEDIIVGHFLRKNV